MDPAALIPAPDQIPVPWGWFQFLLTLTFYLHILAMNVMLGGVIIAFVHHFGREGGSTDLTRLVANKLPTTIALAVNLGVAPLLFAQVIYGHFLYVSSVLMGVFWLSIVGLLILAYYSAYLHSYRYQTMRAGRMICTGLTCLSLLAIGFFLTNNMTLMLHPESWSRYFAAPDGFLLNLADPTLIPRYLHFVVSAVAVGGLSIALWYQWRLSRGDTSGQSWIRTGCTWFGVATILNFGIGFWFFGALPAGLMAPDSLKGGLFSLLLILAVITGALAVIQALRYRPLAALLWILPALLFMVLMRDLLRWAYLAPWFSPGQLEVRPAWSPFLLFLLFLAAGLALVAWMLKTAWTATRGQEVRS